jgi:hypothetical protein
MDDDQTDDEARAAVQRSLDWQDNGGAATSHRDSRCGDAGPST